MILVGIDGSPSTGIELTAASPEWGGRPDKPRDEDYPVTLGAGIFTEMLLDLLSGVLLEVRAVGLGQDLYDYDEQAELEKLAATLDEEEQRAV